jgi:NADPH2:quinone reductase
MSISRILNESLFPERARYRLDALRNLIERGQIKPHIDSVLPLKDVAKGHEKLERGGVRGKIVLRVSKE